MFLSIRKKNALYIIFLLLGGLLIFHLLIISQLIPYDQVWGGRLQSEEEMIRFESFSLGLNAFMLLIYVVKYRQLLSGNEQKLTNFLIWLFATFFLLNTIGNLLAESILEMIPGTIVTLSMVILSVIVVRKP